MSQRRQDIKTESLPATEWGSAAANAGSLQALFQHLEQRSDEAIRWYMSAKQPKKRWARPVRFAAILATSLAALITALGQAWTQAAAPGVPVIPLSWVSVLLVLAAALIGVDHFFDLSRGWMRYITTEMKLRVLLDEFRLDWQGRVAAWGAGGASSEQAVAALAWFKEYMGRLNGLLLEETEQWVLSFQTSLKDLEERVKTLREAETSRQNAQRPAAINLTVSNGDQCPKGWQVTVDDGLPLQRTGTAAALAGLVPGMHTIAVTGQIGGADKRAEQAELVEAGTVKALSLTLV